MYDLLPQVQLDSSAPTKSTIQIGETDYDEVDPCPHLYLRAKAAWQNEAYCTVVPVLRFMEDCIEPWLGCRSML